MLTELSLQNFRIFDEEVRLRLRPITILIGRNSAGKSSLIKFLLMLQQSLGRTEGDFLVSDGNRVKLGAFSELRNSMRRVGRVNLEFGLQFKTTDLPEERQRLLIAASQQVRPQTDPYSGETRFSFSVARAEKQEAVHEEAATVNVEGKVSYGRRQIGKHRVLAHVGEEKVYDESGSIKNPDVRLLRFPPRSSEPHHTVARVLADRYLDPVRYELGAIRHLEPVREESTRVIAAAAPPEHDVGQRGQFAMPHLQRVLQRDDEDAEFVREHVQRIANVADIRFQTSGRGYVAHAKAVNEATGTESYLSDFGFGVGQALPVIVQGAITPHEHLMIVEQPEAQMHPNAQLEMGTLFAGLWSDRRVYSLVETHSSQIILRLRHHIKRGDLSPDDLSIAYVHVNDDKAAVIKNLDVDEEGNLESGLPMEFFGGDIREALAMRAGQ